MRTFELVFLVRFAAIAGVCALAGSPGTSLAFDPAKVFQETPKSADVIQFYFKARKDGNEQDAVDALRYGADNGDAGAHWKLGRMYQMGDGVGRDPLEAFNIFRAIADRFAETSPGTVTARFASKAFVALGRYYQAGIPESVVKPNPFMARRMYRHAALYFRDEDAQFELGRMLFQEGDGFQNRFEAARMFQLSAHKGHVGSQAWLGHILFTGISDGEQDVYHNPVDGLARMTIAADRAKGAGFAWIARMQEDAYSLASEEVRRAAMSLVEVHNSTMTAD